MDHASINLDQPLPMNKARISRVLCARKVYKSENRLSIKISKVCVGFLLTLITASIAAGLQLGFTMVLQQPFEQLLLPGAIAGVCFLMSLLSLYKFAQPMVFDRQSGTFWQGYRQVKTGNNNLLSRIYAIQVKPGFDRLGGYELNLVMTDRSRINLMEHRCDKILKGNAKRLAAFLDVPIWQ